MLKIEKMLTVIIPTYREPEYLDLCLKSLFDTQVHNNKVIVVIDGYYELNKEILKKYKNKVEVLIFNKNKGLANALNCGVYNTTTEYFLTVNDDNVFPKDWDEILLNDTSRDSIISPNQIEAVKSTIFHDFITKDFGRTASTFKYDEFIESEPKFRENKLLLRGTIYPFLMSKEKFMILGGWDTSFPSSHVVDWDFFMRTEMNGMENFRSLKLNFYHFYGKATKNTDENTEINKQRFSQMEEEAHTYFYYKWKFLPYMDKDNFHTLKL